MPTKVNLASYEPPVPTQKDWELARINDMKEAIKYHEMRLAQAKAVLAVLQEDWNAKYPLF